MRWLILLPLCLLSGQAHAGAWAREAGTTFLSFKGSAALDGRDDPPGLSVYLERGWTDRLTLGGKYDRVSSSLDIAEAFARWHLSNPDATWQIAIEGGLGFANDRDADADATWSDRTTGIGAAHLGRGFETPLGSGWIDARIAGLVPLGDDPNLAKIDVTAGLAFDGGYLAMLEFRGTFGREGAEAIHVGPTAAIEFGPTHLTAGIYTDIAGDAPTRGEIGIWLEF